MLNIVFRNRECLSFVVTKNCFCYFLPVLDYLLHMHAIVHCLQSFDAV